MKFLSVCSGIEAASVAWPEWKCIGVSEIEPFPSAVLKHHYPDVPNLGDMTKYKEWNLGAVDLLVGGTPCQSFSVAGLRKGLDDPRGNLMLVYCGILDRFKPKWFVWENVPGVLSSNGGRDFGSFLGAVAELGYGWAYRVLDAQWFGVAQRRRRVFVVGCFGDWRGAAEVLFEPESLRGNPAPSREKRQAATGTLEASLGRSRGAGTPPAAIQPYTVANCLTQRMHKGINTTLDEGQTPVISIQDVTPREKAQNGRGWNDDGTAYTVDTHATQGVAQPVNFYGGNKRADRPKGGFYVRTDEETSKTLDAASGLNPTCSQGGTAVMQPVISFNARQDPDSWHNRTGPLDTDGSTQAVAPSLTASNDPSRSPQSSEVTQQIWAVMQATAVSLRDREGGATAELGDEVQNCLRASSGGGDKAHVLAAMQVRRLTPVECERLQGFPDNYTNIPWRGKPESPDGPRYKALGNSMAVPVMRWIGQRIDR